MTPTEPIMSRPKPMALTAALVMLLAPAHARAADFLGKSVAVWAGDLSSDKAEVRRSAAFALGKIGAGADYDLPRLAALARNDGDPGVREPAAAANRHVLLSITTRDAG